ncbi:MAG: bifunctional glutamate N-acetyltransferase/amino-acid acetyltransferase ArgJ [Proteobacteria bacterium]|nr:bifunctional glutamate N-acetyltransferase/amino-acid acetyltransferase ArgJ [Pseudomonadota bacterium]
MAVGPAKIFHCFNVAGIKLAALAANIRYQDRLDLVLIELTVDSTTAGVFTQNAFCAAPVTIAKQHLGEGSPRYFLINTGNANAGTGNPGIEAALRCCQALADKAGIERHEVLPFSTGVIGEQLPIEKIIDSMPRALQTLEDSNWQAAAQGILTTDTRPKFSSIQICIDDKPVTITGIAKGAGMLKPNLATMLSFVFTDARIAKDKLGSLLEEVVSHSFNRLTVDGDTSTNDSCMLTATGQSGVEIKNLQSEEGTQFRKALQQVFLELATELIRDAEGASKFVTIEVIHGKSAQECLQVAYCVAESPLVKTALFASDPNWGRILAAVGRAGVEALDLSAVSLFLGATQIVDAGAVALTYTEEQGQTEMNRDEITIKIDLARGEHVERVWTSDLSYDYVRINADYRS